MGGFEWDNVNEALIYILAQSGSPVYGDHEIVRKSTCEQAWDSVPSPGQAMLWPGFLALLPSTQRAHTKHHRCSWNEAHFPGLPVHIHISHWKERKRNTISLACISDHILFKVVHPYFICPHKYSCCILEGVPMGEIQSWFCKKQEELWNADMHVWL